MKLFGGSANKPVVPTHDLEQPTNPRRAPDEGPRQTYGIQNAILLMRTLPVENPELVVAVVKSTLESLKVRVSDIIAEASRRQQDIESRVASLRQQILDFDNEIGSRKAEISTLDADHAETSTVKARLELAERVPGGSFGTP